MNNRDAADLIRAALASGMTGAVSESGAAEIRYVFELAAVQFEAAGVRNPPSWACALLDFVKACRPNWRRLLTDFQVAREQAARRRPDGPRWPAEALLVLWAPDGTLEALEFRELHSLQVDAEDSVPGEPVDGWAVRFGAGIRSLQLRGFSIGLSASELQRRLRAPSGPLGSPAPSLDQIKAKVREQPNPT